MISVIKFRMVMFLVKFDEFFESVGIAVSFLLSNKIKKMLWELDGNFLSSKKKKKSSDLNTPHQIKLFCNFIFTQI